MIDPRPLDKSGDSSIPSIYTYFGQFITHDLTLEEATNKQIDGDLKPLDADSIDALRNTRTPKLDLDSVYGPIIKQQGCFPVPRKGQELVVARAVNSQVDGTDLCREPDPTYAARIGDSRNDENLIISQLHLAFVRAHNALVKQGSLFDDAQRLMRHHYQWLVVHDYLNKVADPLIVKQIIGGDINVYPVGKEAFIPLEFSIAAFRFGHSMIRSVYNYNNDFRNAYIDQLMLPKVLGGYRKVLQEWVISWDGFVHQNGPNVARLIDVRVVNPLSRLRDSKGNVPPTLAALDLLRGYLLRLPTGQAVARRLNLPESEIMTKRDFDAVAANDEQREILNRYLFNEATPLWYYILAEASHFQLGQRLGPVGSRLAAGVLIGLLRADDDSIVNQPNFRPTLGVDGQFELRDLLKLAGVLN